MNTYIALFRGVNVGGNNILPMKDLVSIMEGLKLKNVKTYIQSGNAAFQSTAKQAENIAEKISKAVEKDKGFKPRVMVLSCDAFTAAIKNCPYNSDEGKLLHFFFLDSKPEEPNFESIDSVKFKTEKYTLADKVFYLYAPDGIGRSKLVAKVEKAMGVPTTARNLNTVLKLQALANGL